jgi:hypothetical protein
MTSHISYLILRQPEGRGQRDSFIIYLAISTGRLFTMFKPFSLVRPIKINT